MVVLENSGKLEEFLKNDLNNGQKFYKELKRIANNRTYSIQDAEDVVQEFYLKMLKKRNSYDKNKGPVKGYLCIIFVNTCIDYLRKKYKHKMVSFNEFVDIDILETLNLVKPLLSKEKNIEDILSENQIRKVVSRKFQDLPVIHWQVLSDFYFLGLKYEEIKKLRGLPLGTVKSRLFKAKKILRNSPEIRELIKYL